MSCSYHKDKIEVDGCEMMFSIKEWENKNKKIEFTLQEKCRRGCIRVLEGAYKPIPHELLAHGVPHGAAGVRHA